MKRLRIILLFSLMLIFALRVFKVINYKSVYQNGEINIEGIITSIKYDSDMTTIVLNLKEKIIVKYYDYIKLKIGDSVRISGVVNEPTNNKVFNLFDYKKYLLSKRIYKIIVANTISYISRDKNIIYSLKNKIYNRLDSINNSYLYTFILADNRIDNEIYNTYKNNGVSHLFAISGMHIGLFSFILLKILNIFFKNKRISYIITIFLLLIYMSLIGTPSIIRSVLLFCFISMKKILKVDIKTEYLLMFVVYIMLFINPFYIYDIGFQYSFVISFALIKFNYLYHEKRYFSKLFMISVIATLSSLPITINNNFEINIFNPIINIIFVPIISFVMFPLSLLVFIFPMLNSFYLILIDILEKLSLLINNNSIILIMGRINICLSILYYINLYNLFNRTRIYKIIILGIFLIYQYNIHYFNFNNKLTVIDVGQGDSILLELKNKTVILIDTGGNFYYSLATSRIIPYMKSLGIRKLDYMILTHGDYDHMGSSIELVNNFKIDNVILNNGTFNNLESELLKILVVNDIKYYKDIKKFNMDEYELYFLNNKIYDNENDNSIVIYMNLDGIKILMMGDASDNVEHDILNRYDLNNIDILKIGHHGSNTSSSRTFIDIVSPKYSIISVGKNNKFGHPNIETLNNIKGSKIYRTDNDGSIMFEIIGNNIKVKTCM